MVVLPLILAGLWLAWAINWALGAPRSTRVRVPGRLARQRLLLSVPLVVAVLAILCFDAFAHGAEPPTTWRVIAACAGTLLAALGLGGATWARAHLARHAHLRRGNALGMDGPYGKVRHPACAGLLVAFAGSALASCDWRSALAVALATVTLRARARIEDRWRRWCFGRVYDRYSTLVPSMLPRLPDDGLASFLPGDKEEDELLHWR